MLSARRRSLPVSLVRRVVAVALWTVQTLSVASWVRAFQFADDDSGNALRLARECLERGACAAAGNPTSALGLSHGASWTRLVRYCLALGGGLATVQAVVIALLAATTIVTSIVVWRTVSWHAGMMASLLVLPWTLATFRFDNLSNGTLLPLPLTLYYASTLWFVTSRRTRAALVASVFLALSMSPDLECIVALPFHVALVALLATTPLSAATGAALTTAVTFAIESPAAAAQLERGLLRPSLFVLGLLLVTCAGAALTRSGRRLLARVAEWVRLCRRRLLDMPAAARARVVMKLMAVYLIAAVWIGPMIAVGFRIPDAHYFAPALFPLVFFVADATASMSDRAASRLIGILALTPLSLLFAPIAVGIGGMFCTWIIAVAVLLSVADAFRSAPRLVDRLEARPSPRVAIAGAVLVWLMTAPDTLLYPRIRQVWPVATAEHMVRDLYASGFSYAELIGGLQGPAHHTVQTMIVNWDPDLFAAPPRAGDSTSSFLAMIAARDVAARTHDVLMRRDTGDGHSAMIVRSTFVIDRAHVRTCATTSCADPVDPERCTIRDPDGPLKHGAPFFPVRSADGAAGDGSISEQQRQTTYCVRYFVPLRMSGTGEAHWLRVHQFWPLQIRILRVSGVPFEGTVPGVEVRLPNDHPGSGTLEIETEARAFGPNPFIEQPPVMDVTADDEHLLDAFRGGRVTLF